MNRGIETVIQQRLSLQSTQRTLENEFGITNLTVSNIGAKIPNYKFWDTKQQRRFVVALGGRANFEKTIEFLQTVIKV